jgi:hypothetical protein
MDVEAEKAAAIEAIEAAVDRFARAAEAEDGVPFITGWIVAFEFTSGALDDSGKTADDVIVPSTQPRATSRGLLGLGLDHFTRTA